MATKSKLELLLELDDKLFNNKLSQAQKKLSQGIGGMKGKLGQLRDYFQRSFARPSWPPSRTGVKISGLCSYY